jgi:hypothetical protein
MRLRYLRIASLMMCLATVPCTVRAQGSGFGVSVKSSVLAAAGDSITVSYIVRVLPSAHDSLTSFMVDAPGVIRVLMPGAKPEWTVGTRWRLRPVADWGKLSHLITPGDSTPPLQYTAHGMLDVVQYWAELDAPLDSLITETPPDSSLSADTTVTIKGSKGFTIGVGAMPADLSSAALTIRLAGLIDRACALGWIDNRGVCNSLKAKAEARSGPLNAMLNELAAQRGKHVSDDAYLLLLLNANALLMSL